MGLPPVFERGGLLHLGSVCPNGALALSGGAVARDVAVENLQDQYTVFVQNDFTIRASVRVRGFVNQPSPVTLRIDRPDGQTQRLGPIPVTARTDDEQLPVEFRYLPDQPGRYKLTLEAAEQPGELVVINLSGRGDKDVEAVAEILEAV